MITLAFIQQSVYTVKYGVEIDPATAESIIGNPVSFETQVPKGNIRGTACPPITIGKEFSTEKPSYLGFSTDGKYLNITLTNNKPLHDLEGNKDVMSLLTTSYKEVDREVIGRIIAALKS